MKLNAQSLKSVGTDTARQGSNAQTEADSMNRAARQGDRGKAPPIFDGYWRPEKWKKSEFPSRLENMAGVKTVKLNFS